MDIIVPKRIAQARKGGHVRAREEGDDSLLIDKQPAKRIKLSRSHSRFPRATQTQSSPSRRKAPRRRTTSDDSDTELEDDDEYLFVDSPAKPAAKPLPEDDDLLLGREDKPSSPAPESQFESQAETQTQVEPVDPAPGRIIRFAAPLGDFKKNIASGDLVTKAVEDLAFVVQEIAFRPFSEARDSELLECMKELRRVCLEVGVTCPRNQKRRRYSYDLSQEDEIDAWNEFLSELKTRCTEPRTGKPKFWNKVSALGRSISLISKSEAAKQHGKSDITEAKAAEVRTSRQGVSRSLLTPFYDSLFVPATERGDCLEW